MSKLSYRPALDGVRAISIALVLVFHLGAPWMRGGYLGVSVFFTLSGFLITSLLLSERATSGRIDVGAFYVRRLRRLLPASLLVLGGIAVLAAAGVVAERTDLRRGVLGAVLQVANWERLLGDQSYADLFVAPSPVDHFWSLAIEEQFYWLWPLAMAGLTLLAPRRVTRVLVALFGAFAVAALVTAQSLGGDAAYFASWARFAEILAGAALAAVVATRELPRRTSWLAAPCLVAIVVLAVATPAGRGWAYEGGLPLFALLSAGLVLGVQQDGFVTRLLAREPVPWIGRISYGLYLFHWPVFTILDDAPVVSKLALTLALTVASYYAIERPVRTGRVLVVTRRFLPGAAIGFATAAAAAAVLIPTAAPTASSTPIVLAASPAAMSVDAPPTSTIAGDDGSSALAGDERSASAPSVGSVAPRAAAAAPTDPGPRVVALFGDSVADWLLRDAAASFSRADATVIDGATEGCDGAVDPPTARHRSGAVLPMPVGCTAWTRSYPSVLDGAGVDVAVLMVGNRPIADHLVGGRWIGPCTDMQWYVDDLTERIAFLQDRTDEVVVALPPWGGKGASFLATEDHLERTACIRERMLEVVAATGAASIDLAEVLCPAGPDGACPELRADGVHVKPHEAPAVLDWILDRVLHP